VRRGFDELLALGRPALGTWSQMRSEEAVDMVGAAGLDFTIVDCEHGAFGIETAEKLFRACDAGGLVPLVRLPSADPKAAGRALDAGAAGIVVPGIELPGQLAAMVAATRFAPDGTRGACPCVRAGDHFIRDWPAYVQQQRRSIGAIALVETAAGVDAIGEICAVEGLSALLVGPFDLSVSLGHAGDYRHPKVERALDQMIAAATANGVPVFAPIFDPDPLEARNQRDRWLARGARHFVVGTDKILFAAAFATYVGTMRA
jgi:4-hydroxy-2-oxoheptanedioate aldolase